MNLLELRQGVVRQSGRTDLVGFTLDPDGIRIPDYTTDRGVDKFINSAIKTLSQEIKTQDNVQHFTTTISEDAAGIAIPGFLQTMKRGVNVDGEVLCWIRQQDIRGYYDTDIDHTGKPVWWFRITRNSAFLEPYSYVEEEETKYFEIGVYPIPDQEYTLTVSAWTFVPLLAVEDENWWSLNEPKSIIDLACAEIDASVLNADRRVLDDTLARVKLNLLSKDILEEEVWMGNEIR